MNRFYKPTPREYVSTNVDLPWEFLQGVAEQKQKGFDAANAGADATASLLNFNVIPGDTNWKQEKQKQYNDKLYKVRDYLVQTGDFSGASRDLANVTREINQDQDLAIMKAAVAPYEKDRDAYEKMQQEGKLRNQWQSNFRTDYSTRDEKTGRHKSYNQFVGYAAPDYHKAATDSFGDLKLSTAEKGRTYFIDALGVKRDVDEGGGAILKQDIINRAETALPAYRNTDAYNDHIVRATWELKNNLNPDLKKLAEEKSENQAISARADELARQNMISTNLDQVISQSKSNWKDNIYSEQDLKNRGLTTPELPNKPGQDSSLTTQEYKPIDLSAFEVTATPEQMKAAYSGKTPQGTNKAGTFFIATNFDQISNKYRKSFEELYKMFKGETAYNNVKTGKQTLTEDELNQFVALHNSLNKGLRTNTSTAPIGDSTEDLTKLHTSLFGVSEKAITPGIISKGPAGYSDNTKIYNAVKGEWTTVGEMESGPSNKPTKYRINKRYTTQNPLYLLSGKDKRYTKGYSLISEDGTQQYIFPDKENNISQIDELQNQLGSAVYSEGVPMKVDILSKDKNVFSLYSNGVFSLLNIDNEGKPDYYTDEKGNVLAFSNATELQKWITQNSNSKK